MKKVLIIISVFFIFISNAISQRVNKMIIDTKTQKEILYGKSNIEGLKTGEFGDIFKMEYKYYIPDSIVIAQLKPLLKKIRIQIVMGTWCGDSQQQIPRLIKVLDKLDFKYKKLDILCIDHFFKYKDFEKGTNKIEKIPTIIVYRKNKELGRIIETPILSLEKDLLNIIVSSAK